MRLKVLLSLALTGALCASLAALAAGPRLPRLAHHFFKAPASAVAAASKPSPPPPHEPPQRVAQVPADASKAHPWSDAAQALKQPEAAPAVAPPQAAGSVVPSPQPVAAANPSPASEETSSEAGSAAAPAVAGTPVAVAAPAAPPEPAHDGGTPGLKPAKVLFGSVAAPAQLASRAIGSYSRGCLSGGVALPVDGPAWQAMRLSRNRNWGHPKLVDLIEKLATDGREKDGWSGLLVGDMAQPRGGPMATGHASHQVGLDADIWLTPMPDRRLSAKERETINATSMLSDDGTAVNRDVWTDAHLAIIKRAASYPQVERIFVHPAIKQVLCYAAKDDRHWLAKIRPYWGHYYHFHVRISCPPGSAECQPQVSPPGDDGCGKELDDWLKLVNKPEPPPLPIPGPAIKPPPPPKAKPPMTLDQLPQSCSVVLEQGNPALKQDIEAAAKAAEEARVAKIAAKAAAVEAARQAHANAKAGKHPGGHAAAAAAALVAAPAPAAAASSSKVTEKKNPSP